jgi:hypothetical protein
MRESSSPVWRRWLLVVPAMVLLVTACGSAASSTPGASAVVTPGPTGAASSPTSGPTTTDSPAAPASAEASSSGSAAADTGSGTSLGDIPDNAVFLTFRGTNPAFSIQYVEGWQVSQQPDGVVIRDKDSSETVSIAAPETDVKGYVTSTDLPALQAQSGFKLVSRDIVKVGGSNDIHLVYHLPAPPDPVTGKQVPSTVDRYYIPGPGGLAIVSLSTPDGVDNVDAFRQMIQSFRWS